MTKKFFCIAPWVHMYVHPTGDVKTCCVGTKNIGNCKSNSLEEVWNSNTLKQYRLDFLNDNINENCRVCVNLEKSNIHSLRNSLNDLFGDQIETLQQQTNLDGSLNDFKMQYIDIRFSNFCNFKCRMCFYEYSSSILNENNKMTGEDKNIIIYPGKNENDVFEQIVPHIEYAKKIYFAGGEPLIQKEHWQMLDILVENNKTDVELYYNTNMSSIKYKDKHIVDYWKKFSKINVNASIDGWKEQAEYWRSGTKWDIIEQNVLEIKEKVPNITLGTTTTIGWPNVYNALDFIDHCIETQFIKPHEMYINILQTPKYYSLTSIPNFKKELIKKRIKQTIDKLEKEVEGIEERFLYTNLKGMIDFMENNTTLDWLKSFRETTDSLDKIRNENFFEVFPEHNDLKDYM